MASKIVWSENALADLEDLKNYLESNWSRFVFVNFLDVLVKKLQLLEQFPKIGRASEKYPDRRKLVLSKQNILIYSLHNNIILVEGIFDTRQNENKSSF